MRPRTPATSPGSRFSLWLAALGNWLAARGPRFEPTVYAVFAAACTLYAERLFFASMRDQLAMLYASLENDAIVGHLRALGHWSAPLDDVFIHFDFARATARGFPLQWSESNGYSSGGTSLLYPFVLALGYRLGFHDLSLMLWAGIIAFVCVFGLLLASRRLFRGLPIWTSYLAPPALLCTGVLDWTLFSGMEVSLLLALWAVALVAWDELVQRPAVERERRRLWALALGLGLAGAAMVVTRPESATTVAVLTLGAAWIVRQSHGSAASLKLVLAAAGPGALVVGGQALVNRWLTGDSSAAGALAKLELYDPFLPAQAVWGAWWFHVKYQVFRVTEYHLADDGHHGWIVWGLAAIALMAPATRRYALLLWSSAVAWVLLVALNGQVRWQNERYTMPALAWLLLAAALGVAALLTQRYSRLGRGLWLRATGATVTVVAVCLFTLHQLPRFRDQVWFFGRASRNILEQHVRAGLRIRYQLNPTPRRVLVGDAGAIPYAADLPALDIIGLGGFRGMPFARAARLGVPAAIELIERIEPEQRPDLLALYPSWWGDFPIWFGRRITEVPVHGNVICGGPSKVLYGADWTPLRESSQPFGLRRGERIVDELDFADLISEEAHDYALSAPRVGHVQMKLLPSPGHNRWPLWDAGRLLDPPVAETFRLHGFTASRPARLLLRSAPAQPISFAVAVNRARVATVELLPRDSWQEAEVAVPGKLVGESIEVRIVGLKNTRVLHHLWAVQGP